MKRLLLLISICVIAIGATTAKPKNKSLIGEIMPSWSEGYLDIHTISTGRGECLLIVMPDGTSLVVDAGEFSRVSKRYSNVKQRPNNETRPTKAFADYIRHFIPHKEAIDYFNISHFHMDHMGGLEPEYKLYAKGDYILSGVTALYHNLPFREVVDRAYPDYDSLAVKAMATLPLANYRKFLDYQKEHGLKASRFELGAVNQFAMRYNPTAYQNFKIENVCSNGYVWDNGKMVNIYNDGGLRENAASCGFVVRYGDFDFLTAGDIGDGHNLEYRVAKVVGKVEAVKAHHHLSPHSMRESAMDILSPKVMSVTSFYNREIQPDQAKFDYITSLGCKLFCTSVGEEMLEIYPSAYSKCSSTSGHIVFRVEPNGKRFWVYVLDDCDSKYRITKVVGPLKSK